MTCGWGQVLSSPCSTSQDLILPFLDPAVSAPASLRGISQDLTPSSAPDKRLFVSQLEIFGESQHVARETQTSRR